jgi:transposase
LGNPVALMLTPGQAHDLTCVESLLEGANPDALLDDKAYDGDSLIDTLAQRGITPVIPPKANRKVPRACDFALYCERNLIERRRTSLDQDGSLEVSFIGRSRAPNGDRWRPKLVEALLRQEFIRVIVSLLGHVIKMADREQEQFGQVENFHG